MSLDITLTRMQITNVYDGNITHNLGKMAKNAGIYEAMWRPEEIGATYARDIVNIIQKGLDDMRKKPDYYRKFDDGNGWGTYEHFLPFVEKYLEALKEFPDARIEVSR